MIKWIDIVIAIAWARVAINLFYIPYIGFFLAYGMWEAWDVYCKYRLAATRLNTLRKQAKATAVGAAPCATHSHLKYPMGTNKTHTVGIHYYDLSIIPDTMKNRKDLVWWVYYPDELDCKSTTQDCDAALPGKMLLYTGNQSWPTVWATHTVNNICYSLEPNRTPSKHYTILCRKPRPHRVEIMTALHHSGLLGRNHYTWSDQHYGYSGSNVVPTTILDSNMTDETHMWSPPAAAFSDSAASVVLETCEDEIFITEKTFIPLYQRRLPLVYGAAGMYSTLTDWGFEFPQEINFSWDKQRNVTRRRSKFIKELHRLESLYTPTQLAELYQPYAQRNKETLLALASIRPDCYAQWRDTVQVRWAEGAVEFIKQIETPPCTNTNESVKTQ